MTSPQGWRELWNMKALDLVNKWGDATRKMISTRDGIKTNIDLNFLNQIQTIRNRISTDPHKRAFYFMCFGDAKRTILIEMRPIRETDPHIFTICNSHTHRTAILERVWKCTPQGSEVLRRLQPHGAGVSHVANVYHHLQSQRTNKPNYKNNHCLMLQSSEDVPRDLAVVYEYLEIVCAAWSFFCLCLFLGSEINGRISFYKYRDETLSRAKVFDRFVKPEHAEGWSSALERGPTDFYPLAKSVHPWHNLGQGVCAFHFQQLQGTLDDIMSSPTLVRQLYAEIAPPQDRDNMRLGHLLQPTGGLQTPYGMDEFEAMMVSLITYKDHNVSVRYRPFVRSITASSNDDVANLTQEVHEKLRGAITQSRDLDGSEHILIYPYHTPDSLDARRRQKNTEDERRSVSDAASAAMAQEMASLRQDVARMRTEMSTLVRSMPITADPHALAVLRLHSQLVVFEQTPGFSTFVGNEDLGDEFRTFFQKVKTHRNGVAHDIYPSSEAARDKSHIVDACALQKLKNEPFISRHSHREVFIDEAFKSSWHLPLKHALLLQDSTLVYDLELGLHYKMPDGLVKLITQVMRGFWCLQVSILGSADRGVLDRFAAMITENTGYQSGDLELFSRIRPNRQMAEISQNYRESRLFTALRRHNTNNQITAMFDTGPSTTTYFETIKTIIQTLCEDIYLAIGTRESALKESGAVDPVAEGVTVDNILTILDSRPGTRREIRLPTPDEVTEIMLFVQFVRYIASRTLSQELWTIRQEMHLELDDWDSLRQLVDRNNPDVADMIREWPIDVKDNSLGG